MMPPALAHRGRVPSLRRQLGADDADGAVQVVGELFPVEGERLAEPISELAGT